MPMNALILGGMSPRHHGWVRDVASSLRPHFDTVRYLDYRHWQTGETMDLEYEIAQSARIAEDLDEYVIVAKSIGTVAGTLASYRGLLLPKRCVFMGFPLSGVEGEIPEVADALPTLPRTTFVHNEFDKVGTSLAVHAYIEAHSPAEFDFRVVPGNDTHDYIDFELITKLALASPS